MRGAGLVAGAAGAGESSAAGTFLCSGGDPWIQDIKITTRQTTVRTVTNKNDDK